jgi:ATP phosphoribosyltransferase
VIKVALPNKGQLFEPTMDILAACGYKVSKSLRSLSTLDADNGVEFYFLRPGDIPVYVSKGTLDAGITGADFVAETAARPTKLLDLNYGKSKLCAAVPVESTIKDLKALLGLRIATSFPRIAKSYYAEKYGDEQKLRIVSLEGAVEISIKLGIADAIVDIVETGTTLKQAGLKIIGQPLFESQAALYAHPKRESKAELVVLKNRLAGRLIALEYMMVEYDAPKVVLKKACVVTPGIESPTVTSLQKPDWFAVKAMVKRRESQKIMDELAKLGCKGILLTSIDSARI